MADYTKLRAVRTAAISDNQEERQKKVALGLYFDSQSHMKYYPIISTPCSPPCDFTLFYPESVARLSCTQIILVQFQNVYNRCTSSL